MSDCDPLDHDTVGVTPKAAQRLRKLGEPCWCRPKCHQSCPFLATFMPEQSAQNISMKISAILHLQQCKSAEKSGQMWENHHVLFIRTSHVLHLCRWKFNFGRGLICTIKTIKMSKVANNLKIQKLHQQEAAWKVKGCKKKSIFKRIFIEVSLKTTGVNMPNAPIYVAGNKNLVILHRQIFCPGNQMTKCGDPYSHTLQICVDGLTTMQNITKK